ncbi:MAG: helix-turn-helix domain-containing protein [bacterium]
MEQKEKQQFPDPKKREFQIVDLREKPEKMKMVDYLFERGINTVEQLKELLESLFILIPLEIAKRKDLAASEKLLFAEINILTKQKGFCYASNQYLAEQIGFTKSNIRSLIKKLEKKDLIKTEFERNKEGTWRKIFILKERGKTLQCPPGDTTISPGVILQYHPGDTTIAYKREIEIRNRKKDIVASQRGFFLKKFSFKEKLEKMKKDRNRHIQIIALYWQFKSYFFENKDQYQAALRRELRPARALVGYSDQTITEVMYWLEDNTDFKWTLETVHKYIDEPLGELKKSKT